MTALFVEGGSRSRKPRSHGEGAAMPWLLASAWEVKAYQLRAKTSTELLKEGDL